MQLLQEQDHYINHHENYSSVDYQNKLLDACIYSHHKGFHICSYLNFVLLAVAYQLPEKSPANRAVIAMKVVIKSLRRWCGRVSIYFLLLALFGLSYTTSTRAEDANTATTVSDDTTSTTDTTTDDTSSTTTTPSAGITAIIDPGIPEGRLLEVRDEGVLEYDFVNNDSVADDEYDTRHGTIMAEISIPLHQRNESCL